MSEPMDNEDQIEWDWRERPEWRAVETSVANLINGLYPGQDLMVSDFILVVAGVPVSSSGEEIGYSDSFCTSMQPYIARGLLAEGIDLNVGAGEEQS